MSIGYLKRKLKNSLLVIDGLDEIFDYREKRKLMDIIHVVKKEFNSRIVMSTRHMSIDYEEQLFQNDTVTYELLSFEHEQILRLAKMLYKRHNVDGSTALDFLRRIKQNNAFDLASNPLFLTLMVQLEGNFEEVDFEFNNEEKIYVSRLPDSKPELIDKVVEESIHRRWQVGNEGERQHVKKLLSILAWLMFENKNISQIQVCLEDYINTNKLNFVKNYFQFISFIEKLGFVLIDNDIRIKFTHRCFNEYFLAHYYVRYDPKTIASLSFLQEQDSASDVLYYFCYLQENIDDLVRVLIASKSSKVDLSLAMRLLSIEYVINQVELSNDIRELLWKRIKVDYQKNRDLLKEAVFEYKLNVLKISDPVSKVFLPYSIAEKHIPISPRLNNLRGRVSLLNEEQINLLLESINQKYPCEYGHFTLPKIGLVTNSLSPDSVHFNSRGLLVSNNLDVFFKNIKNNMKLHAKEYIRKYVDENDLSFEHENFVLSVISESLELWNPDLYYSSKDFGYIISQRSKLVDMHKDRFIGDKHVDVYSIFLGDQENKEGCFKFSEVFEKIKLSVADINSLDKEIKYSICLIYNSIRFKSYKGIMEQQLKISYLFGIYYTLCRRNEEPDYFSWGRLRLCYVKRSR